MRNNSFFSKIIHLVFFEKTGIRVTLVVLLCVAFGATTMGALESYGLNEEISVMSDATDNYAREKALKKAAKEREKALKKAAKEREKAKREQANDKGQAAAQGENAHNHAAEERDRALRQAAEERKRQQQMRDRPFSNTQQTLPTNLRV